MLFHIITVINSRAYNCLQFHDFNLYSLLCYILFYSALFYSNHMYIHLSLLVIIFLSLLYIGGVQPHFCPSPNPDFDVSWAKMGKIGKKVHGKRGKKYSF